MRNPFRKGRHRARGRASDKTDTPDQAREARFQRETGGRARRVGRPLEFKEDKENGDGRRGRGRGR